MEEEWVSLPSIARELGVSESTCRRWATVFSEWMTVQGVGSARRFSGRTGAIFHYIHQEYARGKTTEQVRAGLGQEFGATMDIVAVQQSSSALSPTESALLAMAEGMQTALHAVEARLLEELTQTQQAFVQLQEEIAAIRAQQVQTEEARRQRALEQERSLKEEIRGVVQAVQQEHGTGDRRWVWPWKR